MTDRIERTTAALDKTWQREGASVSPAAGRDTEIPGAPDLAREPSVIETFKEAVRYLGVVGEEDTAILLFLALTSRLFDKSVSVAIKGLSSSGKSWIVEQTLKFFPPEAFIKFTALSEKAIVHSKEPFKNRTLIFYEVTALREGNEDNLTSYFVRTLLSEGHLVYEYTAGTPNTGFHTERVVKEGPTNVVFTTTRTKVHPENETRCLSLNTDDSPEQTKAVLEQLAVEEAPDVDLRPWHELQRWLQHDAERRVTIPFAKALAVLVPPVAVRLRRDFAAVLALIRAHAMLHQFNRELDRTGQVVATIEDYDAVRRVIADVVSEGVEALVPPLVRETVEAVEALGGVVVAQEQPGDGVTAMQVARHLEIEKMGGGRRLRRASDGGYVRNLETRRFRPGRWVVGEPLPGERDVLPKTEKLLSAVSEGIDEGGYPKSHAAEGDSRGGITVSQGTGDADEDEVVEVPW